MIISRAEFHRRMSVFQKMQIIEEKDELMSVERLFKEIQADAPFRNHNYMFKGEDLSKLELQEDAVGIKNKFPKIKTEGERFEKIKEEIVNDTYKAVPVLRDIDYQDVMYVDDGFHRVFIAHQLGYKVIRVRAKYGKFVLGKSMSLNDLDDLLDMVEKMFSKFKTIAEVRKFLKKIDKEKASHYQLSYGRAKEEER